MRRRQFLQLAASAAAGALVEHASPASGAQICLRIAPVSVEPAPGFAVKGLVVTTSSATPVIAAIEFPQREHWLGISGWTSLEGPIEVIHVMLEKRPAEPWSHSEIEFPLLQPGRRYRLRVMNATPSSIAVHLPGRRVELARYSVVEADLIAGV